MNRLTITPESEQHWLDLRAQDLTSTDAAALFGLSPYKALFELWHEKKSGEIVRLTENDRMRWGRRLEATVAQGILEDMDWCGREMKEYVRLPEHRIGASFDWRVHAAPDAPGFASDSDDDAILEIKTVDFLAFRDGWTIDDGFIEAPPHIEIQVQHQMLVSGLRRAYIGVMVGGNRIEVIERQADDAVHAGIIAKAAEFWQSIADNRAPEPVMPDDAQAVIRMYQVLIPKCSGRGYGGGALIGVYAIARLSNGMVMREVMDKDQIDQVRMASRSANAGPWKQWYDEMARKTVIRRLAKRLPILDAGVADTVAADDDLYDFAAGNAANGDTPPAQQPTGPRRPRGLDVVAAAAPAESKPADDVIEGVSERVDTTTGEVTAEPMPADADF